MDPPVRKRGRPRNEDRKRRGRKPNPDTVKKIKTSNLKTAENKKLETEKKGKTLESNTAPDKHTDLGKKIKTSESKKVENKELEPFKKSKTFNKQPDILKKTKTPEMNITQHIESDTVKKMKSQSVSTMENRQLDSPKKMKTSEVTIAENQQDTVKKMKKTAVSTVENRQLDLPNKMKTSEVNIAENEQGTVKKMETPALRTMESRQLDPPSKMKTSEVTIARNEKQDTVKKIKTLAVSNRETRQLDLPNIMKTLEVTIVENEEENTVKKTETPAVSTMEDKELDLPNIMKTLEVTIVENEQQDTVKKIKTAMSTMENRTLDPPNKMKTLEVSIVENELQDTVKKIITQAVSTIEKNRQLDPPNIMKTSEVTIVKNEQQDTVKILKTPAVSTLENRQLDTVKEMKTPGVSTMENRQLDLRKEVKASEVTIAENEQEDTVKTIKKAMITMENMQIDLPNIMKTLEVTIVENEQQDSSNKTKTSEVTIAENEQQEVFDDNTTSDSDVEFKEPDKEKEVPSFLESSESESDESDEPGQDSDIKMLSLSESNKWQCKTSENETSTSATLPTRMKEKLPKCYVLLHRLTEKEIYQAYPCENHNEVSDDVMKKTEELLWKTVEAINSDDDYSVTFRRDGSKRRKSSKVNSSVFELYKQTREEFMNRRNNKASYSENSLDWTSDEFRTFSDDSKPKKKLKRGRKYELDFEWTPDTSRDTPQSTRTLRRHSRRPLIESDSSSSDEEDILYQIYLEDNNSNACDKSAFVNAVPSENATSASFLENSALKMNCSDKFVAHQNSSLFSDKSSALQKTDSVSGDIVSGIIENMNQLQNSKLKTSFSDALQSHNTLQINNFQRKTVERRKKRPVKNSKSSEEDVDRVVAMMLKEMINKVSYRKENLEKGIKKFMNTCKWCHSPFPTNISSEVWCAICTDLGKGEKCKSLAINRKPLNSGKIKPLKENKGKRVSAISRVLKKLPKNEMRRLMYAEKTGKMCVEKGYNHCKSFQTPKDIIQNNSDTYKYVDSGQNNSDVYKNADDSYRKHTNKISLKINQVSKTSPQLKRKNNSGISNYKSSNKILPKVKSRIVANEEHESNQNKSSVSLEKYNEGLFLMTFPDPDKELDLDLEDKPHHIRTAQNEASSENTNKLNVRGVANNKPVSLSTKKSQPSSNKKYDTYLFPPLPTVIVSNYCSDTSSLNLSDTFFQNEITHQHALKSSKTLPNNTSAFKSKKDLNNAISNTKGDPVTIASAVSYQNSSLSTSSLSSNSSLSISSIPVSKNVTNMQPFSFKSMPVLNPNTSVSGNNITLLPIVSSVVSLSDKNTQGKRVKDNVPSNFSTNNFVNSQQLDIKIDNVTSLKTYQKLNEEVTESLPSESTQNKHVKTSVIKQVTKSNEISIKRKRLNSGRNSSDYSDASDQENIAKHSNPFEKNKENSVSKHSDKSPDNKENAGSQGAITSAMNMLDAISILAVIDLEKNPQSGLNVRIQLAKNDLEKLTSKKIATLEHNEKIASCQNNLQLLNTAKKYLSLYGSFIKVSDHLLRKTKMIQIKKEILAEETNQSSCRFSQSNSSLSGSQSDLSRTPEIPSPTVNQIDNFKSCRSNAQTPVSHIEKLQCQIAAMNNVNVAHYGSVPGGGTVHHYPSEQIAALPPAVAAPTPVTPRNDCLVGESRETPSRGSGPRTPARPESAASQSEEQSLIQIKKELIEAAASSPSQCAYSQNTALPQISSQLPVMSEVTNLNLSQNALTNTTVQLPISTNQIFTNQQSFTVQSTTVTPNRTVTYSNNQNYSDVFLNIGSKHQLHISPAAPNSEMSPNRQVILGQQMFIQNGPGLCTKQAVPSVNNSNQYVIRPPFTSANTGGTVIVNNTQVGQNALLTNVSNQQFYTSNQVSQLYYPPSTQITCMPSNTMVTQEVTATQIQQAEIESSEMFCAVCKSQATLRCKQCARVAYCNTICAKTYWHQKHKMECKPLNS